MRLSYVDVDGLVYINRFLLPSKIDSIFIFGYWSIKSLGVVLLLLLLFFKVFTKSSLVVKFLYFVGSLKSGY